MKKNEEPDITDVIATISGIMLGAGTFMICYWAYIAS